MKEHESEDDGYQMSPEAALKLYNEGGFLVVTQLPPGSEFGIDLYSWNTGEKFLGVKMIPPGLHFVYYSTAGQGSSGPQLAPRTGFSSGVLLHHDILSMFQASSTPFTKEKWSLKDTTRVQKS